MNVLVTTHLHEGTDEVAQALAAVAVRLSAGTPITQWIDAQRTAFRASFLLAADAQLLPLDALVDRFEHAAGRLLRQVIVVAATDPNRPAQVSAEPASTLLVQPPVSVPQRPAVAAEPTSTLVETPRLHVPPPARVRDEETGKVGQIELAVHAASPDGIEGVVVATGEVLNVQTKAAADVVPGEATLVSPTKYWRFAKAAMAAGEVRDARLAPELFGKPALRLVVHADATREIERVVLEGDPDDPQDNPIEDAREALASGFRNRTFQLLHAALREDIRCLQAHDLLARIADAENRLEQAARHDAVLLAFAAQTLPDGFDADFPRRWSGNEPIYAAIERRLRTPDAGVREHPELPRLVARWSALLCDLR